MAYRDVTMLEVKEVLRLWLTGVRKKRIATQLGLNVKTVRRYLRAAQAHGLTIAASPDQLDDGLRADVRLSKIRTPLRRQGVTISYPTLRRFAMEKLGWGRAALTIPLADCDPGEEVQLDTGWMTHVAPDALGRRRRFRAWIFRKSHDPPVGSRLTWTAVKLAMIGCTRNRVPAWRARAACAAGWTTSAPGR